MEMIVITLVVLFVIGALFIIPRSHNSKGKAKGAPSNVNGKVSLDFIRQINDDNGPMEEQRERYGPSLYTLTKMVLNIRLFLLLSWGRAEQQKIETEKITIVQQAADVYTSEFEKFINFIGNSDEYKETTISAGKTHEVVLTVDAINSYIAWDFSLIQGMLSLDIGIHVEYVSPTGETTLILPYRRYESDQGNFCTILAGSYRLVWDNSYLAFFKKVSQRLRLRFQLEPSHLIEVRAWPTRALPLC